MSEESISQNHYSYSFDESVSSYSFSTERGIIYRVAFTRDQTLNTLATTEEFDDQYQLIIERVSDLKSNHDPKVEETIGEIIIDFFKNRVNSLLCIYTDKDGKEAYRYKAFARWYRRSKAKSFIVKEDRILEIEFEGEINYYYTSFLYHIDNPNKTKLLEAYDRIVEALLK